MIQFMQALLVALLLPVMFCSALLAMMCVFLGLDESSLYWAGGFFVVFVGTLAVLLYMAGCC